MYHTEGYIDKESVDSSSHMISLAGKLQYKDVLVWAVWQEAPEARQYQERLRQWLVGELGAAGSVTPGQINREMLRISSSLNCSLYLYYDKKLYRAGEQAAESEYYIGSSLGVCVHREGGREEFLKEHCCEESCTGELSTKEIDPALLGNVWQKNIMDCVMEDSLSYAYFMLWEVR
ncbi:MAG: hypothetical protein LUC90_05200 [Lachnospiraceae bacterium]|nr:hypothetical protein [Lachnospiraceae bacterium]